MRKAGGPVTKLRDRSGISTVYSGDRSSPYLNVLMTLYVACLGCGMRAAERAP